MHRMNFVCRKIEKEENKFSLSKVEESLSDNSSGVLLDVPREVGIHSRKWVNLFAVYLLLFWVIVNYIELLRSAQVDDVNDKSSSVSHIQMGLSLVDEHFNEYKWIIEANGNEKAVINIFKSILMDEHHLVKP